MIRLIILIALLAGCDGARETGQEPGFTTTNTTSTTNIDALDTPAPPVETERQRQLREARESRFRNLLDSQNEARPQVPPLSRSRAKTASELELERRNAELDRRLNDIEQRYRDGRRRIEDLEREAAEEKYRYGI